VFSPTVCRIVKNGFCVRPIFEDLAPLKFEREVVDRETYCACVICLQGILSEAFILNKAVRKSRYCQICARFMVYACAEHNTIPATQLRFPVPFIAAIF
jgi:hypothetical protein